MKKFYSFFAMAMAGTLVAGAFTVKSGSPNSVADKIGSSVPLRLDGQQAAPFKSAKSKVFGKLPPMSAVKSLTRAGEDEEIISEAPAGKNLSFCGNSFSFYVDYGEVMQDEWFGLAYDAVLTDDGDFYLKNPVSTLHFDTYIKGKVTDSGLEFEFPQPLYKLVDEDMDEVMIYADVLEYAEIETPDGEYMTTLIPSENTRTLIFDKDEEGNYLMDPDYMLGVTAHDVWQGYGEYNLVLNPFEAEVTKVPESVIFNDTYILADEIFGWDETILNPVSIGVDGNDVYIKGACLALPDAVIKGSLDPETKAISIHSNQLMGRFFNYYLFYMNGDGYEYYDEDWECEMISLEFTDEITLAFDAENDVYTPVVEDDHFASFIFNFGNADVTPCEYYQVDRIYSQGEIKDYAPMAPVITDVYSVIEPSDGEYSYCIEFLLFSDNNDGQILNDKNIYYNVFVNGKLYPLTVEEFPSLEYYGASSITDIPVGLSDDDDIFAMGSYHGISFRNMDIKTIGIRSVYIDGEIRAESEIVTVDVELDSVEGMDSVEARSVEYFDMAGRSLTYPVAGTIAIRKATLSDGSIKFNKVVIR